MWRTSSLPGGEQAGPGRITGRGRSTPPGGLLGADRRVVAVAGVDDGLAGRVSSRSRIESMIVAKSRVRPAGRAGAAVEQRVAGEDDAQVRRRTGSGAGRVARRVQTPAASMPATSKRRAVGELAVRRACRVVDVPQHPVGRGAAGSARRCARPARGGVDVVVVPVGQTIATTVRPPTAARIGGGVVGGVDDDDLVVVADDPDVVVDVPRAAVEARRCRR